MFDGFNLMHFVKIIRHRPGPEVINLFSASTQLSMKIFPLMNVKMPTGLTEPKNAEFLDIFILMSS